MSAPIENAPASVLRTCIGTTGVVLCHAVALAITGAVLLVTKDYYAAHLAGSDREVPAITRLAVDLQFLMHHYWHLLVLGLVPDGTVHFFLSRRSPAWNWLAGLWAFLPLLAALTAVAAAALGMCAPWDQAPPA